MSIGKLGKLAIKPWQKHVVKGKYMNFIRGIQNTRVFHAAEQIVKGVSKAIENVSPKAFYPLVMNAPASDVTSSIWTSKGMAQHIPGDIHILATFITSYPRR